MQHAIVALSSLGSYEQKIEVRCLHFCRTLAEADAGQLHTLRTLLMHEHDLEKRMPAEIPRRTQLVNQLLEWQVLMVERLQAPFADLLQKLSERRVTLDLRAHHERVHEESDDVLEFGPVPVCHRRSHANVTLPADRGKEHVEPGQQCHKGGRADAAGERVQGIRGRSRNRKARAAAAIAVHFWPLEVRR